MLNDRLQNKELNYARMMMKNVDVTPSVNKKLIPKWWYIFILLKYKN